MSDMPGDENAVVPVAPPAAGATGTRGVAFDDTDGGVPIPVLVADPSHEHGEHHLSLGDEDLRGTRSRNEEAVSVERFFQQELASLSPDLTVRRGDIRVHSEGKSRNHAPPPLSLSLRVLDGRG
jgi:hypothetical protein